jgi:hypothetical protein
MRQQADHLARALLADGGWWGPPMVARWASSQGLDEETADELVELLERQKRAVVRRWDGLRQVRAAQGARGTR